MGSFIFKWDHPAEEVYVTGTFDNWSKSVQLDKTASNSFEKSLALPHTGEKIFYKFVADGVWIHDHTAKTETDEHGNVNNVIEPSDITPAAPFISSVGPGASTTESDEMAKGKKNKNNKAKSAAKATEKVQEQTPGAFPETPVEEQNVSVNPIPASEGTGNPVALAAGEKVPEPSTINANTIESGVHDDEELKAADQTASIAPIPATGGIGNPVSLAPGEKVPDASTLTSNTIDSNVKLDKESYEKSDSGAPVLPPISGTQLAGGAGLLGGAALAGGAAAGLAHKDTPNTIPESSLPMGQEMPADISSENVGPHISSVAPQSTTAQLAGAVPLEKHEKHEAPAVVSESQQEAGVAPEASANSTAVEEKEQMEKELQSKVPEAPAISSVAPESTTNALAGAVPLEHNAPAVVSESQKEAGVAPEASTNPEAVDEKEQMEKELQSKVPEAPATSTAASTAANGTVPEAKKEFSSHNDGTVAGIAAGGVAAAGAAAAGTAYALREKAKDTTGKDPVSYLPESVQTSIDGLNKKADAAPSTAVSAGTADAVKPTVSNEVPAVVSESQKEAHANPEASANAEAVHEKEAMESELLKKVPTSEAQGEPAPSTTAATSTTAPAATVKSSSAAPVAAATAAGAGVAGAGAAAVAGAKSSSGAPQLSDPTAGVSALSMDDNKLNAPATAPAVTPATKAIPVSAKTPLDSRDVSPMSKPKTAEQTQPVVTTGVDSSKTAAESKPATAGAPVGTPRKENSNPAAKRNSIIDKLKGTPESSKKGDRPDTPATTASGKEKKKGFFSRLKEKLK